MSEQPAVTAIIFACDEAYVFLARGLVLSLADAGYPRSDTKLVLVDIGCGPESLAWMRDQGVEIVPFDPALIPQKIMSVITPVQRAMAVRPWLPELLPQFDHFVWLDCDLWVQNGDFMQQLRAGANAAPDAIMLAPGNSHYNASFYVDIERILNMQRGWYTSCYQADFARKIATTLHFSGGVWGMRRSSPFWAHWRNEVEHVYPTVAVSKPNLLHLAEQIALNVTLFRTKLYVRLDPLYNFHCNASGAVRALNGRVVTNLMLPSREVGVIHLANWSLLRELYIKMNLLYRSGDYLTEAERARLTA
jgi:hypothetical protein